ncbi:30S ribosomal protein S8 [uncultured Campylobacter sp.]|uniref:30S ribosomal protein S8 n=1 Tax=uncultured Campylobacter sp. TaxID=218934 RepID=UPI00261799C7|nr:30S ribosomal protein S8 [uncultured Campylobacter sp.]
MLNDIVSDSITRIRNAALRRLETTKLLHSKVVEAIVEIFVDKGYLDSFNIIEEGNKKFINVVLKYDEKGKSPIHEITRVSKPGRRIYQGKDDIKRFKNGYGTVVVSTSKGVMSGIEASKAGIGGEVLCTIW